MTIQNIQTQYVFNGETFDNYTDALAAAKAAEVTDEEVAEIEANAEQMLHNFDKLYQRVSRIHDEAMQDEDFPCERLHAIERALDVLDLLQDAEVCQVLAASGMRYKAAETTIDSLMEDAPEEPKYTKEQMRRMLITVLSSPTKSIQKLVRHSLNAFDADNLSGLDPEFYDDFIEYLQAVLDEHEYTFNVIALLEA